MNSNGRIERIPSYALDEHLRQPHISALKRFAVDASIVKADANRRRGVPSE